MRLEDALDYYRHGHNIRRLSWEDRKRCLSYNHGGFPCMRFSEGYDSAVVWPTPEDILADDWDVAD